MKMVMVVYNEAVDQEVMEILSGCGTDNYTKAAGIYGKGNSSGTHLGTDVWPGKNNLLYVACSDPQSANLIIKVKELREKIGYEGIKAFVLPIESMT
jgi:nitrogen regulatory protein PII